MVKVSKNLVPKEYLGAFKKGHRRASREFIDESFASSLLAKARDGCEESKVALTWLTKFNNEYHKNVIKKGDETALHVSDEMRRDCYRREYARRNDLYTSVSILRFLDDWDEDLTKIEDEIE